MSNIFTHISKDLEQAYVDKNVKLQAQAHIFIDEM